MLIRLTGNAMTKNSDVADWIDAVFSGRRLPESYQEIMRRHRESLEKNTSPPSRALPNGRGKLTLVRTTVKRYDG